MSIYPKKFELFLGLVVEEESYKPKTQKPKPQTLNPKPQTLGPKPCLRNPCSPRRHWSDASHRSAPKFLCRG